MMERENEKSITVFGFDIFLLWRNGGAKLNNYSLPCCKDRNRYVTKNSNQIFAYIY